MGRGAERAGGHRHGGCRQGRDGVAAVRWRRLRRSRGVVAMRHLPRTLVLASLVAGLAAMAAAPAPAQQAAVTQADFARLDEALADAAREVAALRSRDAALADRLQAELNDLRDEVAYLKVKQRKERSVTRADYFDLRDRIDDVRLKARGESRPAAPGGGQPAPASSSEAPRRSAPGEIPVGQEIDVRLQTRLSSGTAQVEDRFEATTVVDLYQDEKVLVPAGSVLRGVVRSVDPATRTDRKGSLTLAFDRITVRGREYPIRATVTQALESEGIRGEIGRIGTGAGVGAIIGGIIGGVRGVLAGLIIGAGGTIAATEGKDVDLPAGTVLRVRFDSPVTIR
jgi:type II secretory pathway pseudopilin PulG